jgi:tRNA (Thr-GGU) A37 N-methylase
VPFDRRFSDGSGRFRDGDSRHASAPCVEERLQVVPYLDDRPHGIFATRAPARPNHLGLSIVRLVSRIGRILEVAGNDMLDGTPVLDIKPYVPPGTSPLMTCMRAMCRAADITSTST